MFIKYILWTSKSTKKQSFNLKSASTTQRLLNTQPVFFTVDQTFRIMIKWYSYTFLSQYIVLMGNTICDSWGHFIQVNKAVTQSSFHPSQNNL